MGDPGDDLIVILSGTAQAFIRRGPGDRTMVGSFRAGDIVGEIGVLTGEPRTADVVAATEVRALRLSAADFSAVASARPEVRVLLTNIVADHLGQGTYDGLGGKTIHGYQVRRCIGRGGMGVVYEAERFDGGDVVALKMMNHRLLYRPRAVRRFQHEADALELLRHPSIARLYGHFSAYGTQFLVMEYCEGPTLAQVFAERGALDESVVRPILGQLADALRYVHTHGLIHHDLKPSNVILSPSGLIKLMDFGLVRSDPTDSATATSGPEAAGEDLLGTPRYMAPEQFRSGGVDKRIDVYGLGCVVFEALAGRPVIKAPSLVVAIHEKLTFVLPPAETIGRGVSQEMHEFLARALQTRPAKRTVDLDALARWAGPVTLPAPGPPPESSDTPTVSDDSCPST